VEHDAYWIYYHQRLSRWKWRIFRFGMPFQSSEYGIYKTLIGFEGIFGEWEKLKTSEAAWDFSDEKRNANAERFAEDVTETTYDSWRQRILRFSETESTILRFGSRSTSLSQRRSLFGAQLLHSVFLLKTDTPRAI